MMRRADMWLALILLVVELASVGSAAPTNHARLSRAELFCIADAEARKVMHVDLHLYVRSHVYYDPKKDVWSITYERKPEPLHPGVVTVTRGGDFFVRVYDKTKQAEVSQE
jgi:hypothetical protein